MQEYWVAVDEDKYYPVSLLADETGDISQAMLFTSIEQLEACVGRRWNIVRAHVTIELDY